MAQGKLPDFEAPWHKAQSYLAPSAAEMIMSNFKALELAQVSCDPHAQKWFS